VDQPHPRNGRPPKLSFGVIFGVLFVFWAATCVCVAAIVTVSAWDARSGESAAGPTPAPTATATPSPRPPSVPSSAEQLDGAYDSGMPEQHLFFNLACAGGVLVVITTDEHVYGETDCPPAIERFYLEPFLGDAVRLTVAGGVLEIVTTSGERLTFNVGRVWVERR
jgi:hypothetical protein